MIERTAEYQATAKAISFNVANKVLPMDKLPETLLEAYEGLFKELIQDNAGLFEKVGRVCLQVRKN